MAYYKNVFQQLDICFKPSAEEIVDFCERHDKMNVDEAVSYMKQHEIERILERHPYSIYQATDGRWCSYIKELEDESSRKRIVRTHLKDLYEFLYRFYAQQDDKHRIAQMTLMDLYPEWMEFKALHTDAVTTLKRIEVDWNKFYLSNEIVAVPLIDLDKSTLDKWAHQLVRDYGLTKKQYYNMAVIMNQALGYAVDKSYISENLFKEVHVDARLFRPVKKKDSATQVFMENEEDVFKDYAWAQLKEGRHKKQPLTPLAVLFLLQTGLRIGELRALKYDDICTEGKYVLVNKMIRNETGEVVEHTKGKYGDRIVPLTDEAIRIINKAREIQTEKGASSQGYIFSMTDKPIGYYAVNRAFYMYCDAIGSERKSTHKARKTVVSALFDADMNPDAIRRLVGHVDLRTTYNNYCYDRRTDESNRMILNRAL